MPVTQQIPDNAKDWIDDDDPGNPRNWSFARSAVSTAIVSGIAFISTLAASIYSPGHQDVARRFGVSPTVSLLPLSFYNLGLAFGPVIGAPLSETFGRKTLYLTTTPIFALFILGSGLSQSISALTVCRFFAGVFGSPAISNAAATITDYSAARHRAVPLAIYYAIPFLGAVLGPLIGGFVVEARGWRWTQWTVLFFVAVLYGPVFLVRESYKNAILQHRAKRFHIEGPPRPQRGLSQAIEHFMTSIVIRPIHMLTTEPIVSFVCLYTAFQFGLLYTFVVASPYIFATVYNFSPRAQGLSFLGLIVGCLIAPLPIIAIDRVIYQSKLTTFTQTANNNQADTFPPEHRLYSAMAGSILLPIALFAFAWTARSTVDYVWPIMLEGVVVLSSLLIYVSANLFMMDTYGPLYGASASGASMISRYTLSAAFPLFTLQMYSALGVAWATSVLAFCALAMAPIPWVFWRLGPKLRARSRYEHSI